MFKKKSKTLNKNAYLDRRYFVNIERNTHPLGREEQEGSINRPRFNLSGCKVENGYS